MRLFSSPIYYAKLGSSFGPLNRKLIREGGSFSDLDGGGKLWSKKNYPGGYTSYGSLDRLFDVSPTFEDLRRLIDPHARKYLRSLGYDLGSRQIEMVTLWINIMPAGARHTAHIHPGSVVSGTVYLQTPKDCSPIVFEDPRLPMMMNLPPPKIAAPLAQQRFVRIPAKAGHIVLFESWMRHEVPINSSKTPRISASFNYDWCR